MIPILYDIGETAFTSNGLGRLADCISCTVTEERNGIYECQFEYPVSGEMYPEITEGRILGVVHDDKHDIQPFDIYGRSAPLNGVVTFYAHHISYRLGNIVLKPVGASSCAAALAAIPNNTYNPCPFTFWTDKTTTGNWTVTVPSAVRAILSGQAGSILDVYGKGDYEFDRFSVKLYLERGNDNGVAIRYGVNLTDLTQEVDTSAAYTAVVPYWLGTDGELVTLPEGYVARTGMAVVPIPLDLSSEWQDAPTVEQLREKATAKLSSSEAWLPNENITVSFIDLSHTEEYKNVAALQRVSLCDKVSVFCADLDVSVKMRVIRVVYNTLTEMYDEIELGDARSTLASTIAAQFAEATADLPTMSQLRGAVDNATAQITGAMGGFVRFMYDADGHMTEILIMDTDDIATARKVWRWNSGGLGYSSNGYDGPYGTAITQDGSIVADYITSGTMDANLLRTGVITSRYGGSYWDLDTGVLMIGNNADIGGMSAGDVVDSIGSSITGVETEFAQNQDSAVAPTSGWSTVAPSWAAGWYIWQRTKTTTPNGIEYSDPTCISGRDGSGSQAGLNQATLYLYQRAATQPAKPAVSMTYTFASGELTGIPAGWSRTIPTGSESCWVTSAAAISSDTAVTLASNAWQDAVMMAQSGAAVQEVVNLYAVSDSTIPPEDSMFHELGEPVPWTDNNDQVITDNFGEPIYFMVNEAPIPTALDRYVWQYQRTTYTDGTTLNSTKSITAVYGGQGVGVSEIVEQYYLSTSDEEPTGGAWSERQPEWQAGTYLWTRSRIRWTDDAITTTDPVLAKAINAANEAAAEAEVKARTASAREQIIYHSAVSGTISLPAYTTWVESSANAQNVWTTARPVYNGAYPVCFVATQRQTVEQRSGTTCSCTTPVVDQTTTIIDGGHITTGTIDAGVVNVTNIKAGNITSGYLRSDLIAANSIAVSKLTGSVSNNGWVLDLEHGTFTIGNISAANINTGTLNAAVIGATSITSDKIAANAITTDKISANAITSGKIAANAITADKIAAGTITSDRLSSGVITSISNAQSAADSANDREQTIYKSAPAGTSTMAGTTTWITSTSNSQNAWTTTRPTYNSTYPVLFVATQRQTVSQKRAGTTCSCTTPVIDRTTTVIDGGNIITGTVTANKIAASAVTADKIEANAITSDKIAANAITASKIAAGSIDSTKLTSAVITSISTAQSTADSANKREQTIYKSARSGTSTMAGTTTWVTSTSNSQGAWTRRRPEYSSTYPVLFVASQRQTVAQQKAGDDCSCTTPIIDDTLTVIDGGHITTGTIDASTVSVTNINASNIKTGTLDASIVTVKNLDAGKINTGSLTIGGSKNNGGAIIVQDNAGDEVGRWSKGGISISKGEINIGAFKVTTAGKLTCTDANLSGTITTSGPDLITQETVSTKVGNGWLGFYHIGTPCGIIESYKDGASYGIYIGNHPDTATKSHNVMLSGPKTGTYRDNRLYLTSNKMTASSRTIQLYTDSLKINADTGWTGSFYFPTDDQQFGIVTVSKGIVVSYYKSITPPE